MKNKKNLDNLVKLNTPANTANTALMGKENVMKTDNNTDKLAFVEGLALASILGIPVPLGATICETLAFQPSETAVLLVINHAVHLFFVSAFAAMEKGVIARSAITFFTTIMSGLFGFAMYRCLADGFGAAVDYTSVASVVITTGLTAFSLMTFAVVTDALKSK